MADPENNEAAQEQDPAQAGESEGVEIGVHGPVGYAPSAVESTRARTQGLGVGQTDLDQQRDPTRYDSSEKT